MSSVTILEYGSLYRDTEKQDIENTIQSRKIGNKAFHALRNFIAENTDREIEIEKAFSYHKRKGIEFIKVKNLVGVVETKDKTVVEILPKTCLSGTKDEEIENRNTFLRMLRYLKDSPFTSIDTAHLKNKKFPVLEVFISTFLDELEQLVKTGIRKYYKYQEDNRYYLKGKLLFKEQINQNLVHKERFYTRCDEFTLNIPQNRLIKATLFYLNGKSRLSANTKRMENYINLFESIPLPGNLTIEFQSINSQSRVFIMYEQVLKWAKVFLNNESFINYKGNSINKAILFPMERIFEDYVAAGLRKANAFKIKIQDKTHSLVDEHIGKPKFKLKPDIVIEDRRSIIIIDTKWKIIDSSKPRKNYEINQHDMYQLFAYGKKYRQAIGSTKNIILYLVYPRQEKLLEPLSEFVYDLGAKESENLKLFVYPYDLQKTLKDSTSELLDHFYSKPEKEDNSPSGKPNTERNEELKSPSSAKL